MTTGSASLALGGTLAWPAVLPGPIGYAVAMPPEMVNNGQIQYFAAMGFTVCYLVALAGDMTSTYTAEKAKIEALGMTAILNIDQVCQYWFNNGVFTIYETWFTNLAAAGWKYVSFELGVTDPANIATELAKYFTGYVYHFAGAADLTFYYDSSSPPKYVWGLFLEENCVRNDLFYRYDSIANIIKQIAVRAYPLGIPHGLIAGAWTDNNVVWSNSLAKTTPSVDGTTGNTYQSLLDWSFQNGMPMSHMGLWFAPDMRAMIDRFFGMSFDRIFNDIMQTYPAAGTSVLVAPSVKAALLTMSTFQSGDNVTFNCNIRELVSGNPISGATINLQRSTDDVTYANYGSPATSSSSGNFTFNVTLTAGTYYFRLYYAGDANYNYTYGPWGHKNSGYDNDGTKIIAP
jgi:hypothetical protein